MRPQTLFAILCACVVTLTMASPAGADVKRFRAFVYPDKSDPGRSLVVEDFRVNETVWDEGGVQYVRVIGPDGAFRLPFNVLGQIEMVRFLGLVDSGVALYEVRVTTKGEQDIRIGHMELRVMRGMVSGNAWHLFPASRPDHGANLWRIVVGDVPMEPTVPLAVPVTEPAAVVTAPAPVLPPPGTPEPPGNIPGLVAPPSPPLLPPVPSETGRAGAGAGGEVRRRSAMDLTDDEFARMTLDELNALEPLDDAFFDLDRSTIRIDAADALQRDRDFLRRFGSTKILITGHTDPRGTHEHNLSLGRRRAENARGYLIKLGIPANRITVRSVNSDAPFCTQQTEACWQENRRAHFVITAK